MTTTMSLQPQRTMLSYDGHRMNADGTKSVRASRRFFACTKGSVGWKREKVATACVAIPSLPITYAIVVARKAALVRNRLISKNARRASRLEDVLMGNTLANCQDTINKQWAGNSHRLDLCNTEKDSSHMNYASEFSTH
jgi:hypothetical protein